MPSQLPETLDPLTTTDGKAVTDAETWFEQRVPELRAAFQREVYGRMPEAVPVRWRELTTADDLCDGAVIYRGIELELELAPDRIQRVQLALFTPAGAERPPVFVVHNGTGNPSVIDHPAVLASQAPIMNPHQVGPLHNDRGSKARSWPIAEICRRGYALATYCCGDIDPDDPTRPYGGVREVIGGEGDQRTGTIACWAWGLSRVLDALEQMPFVDASRAAVSGMSRRGKAALVAGAFDPRFKLVIPHQSGTGGLALSRGATESVSRICSVFPHWFCPRYAAHGDNLESMPLDQHLLVALCAPRAVLGLAGDQDEWASPQLADESLRQAAPVWKLLGADDRVGIHRDALPDDDLPLLNQLWRDVEHRVDAEFWAGYLAAADRHL